MLAAAGSEKGASRAIFTLAPWQNWKLLTSPYALDETNRNISRLPLTAAESWQSLQSQVEMVTDVFALDRPSIFTTAKDRPILFTALAWAEVLLTLDRSDFAGLLGSTFYGLHVLLPYAFLQREREAGNL